MYSKNGTGSIAQIRLNIVVMQNNSDKKLISLLVCYEYINDFCRLEG